MTDMLTVAGRGAVLAPVPTTRLVGRHALLAGVVELVGAQRLVTLTGAGGAGKTILAAHVARAVSDAEGSPAWWADLAPVHDPERVATVICAAVGLDDVSGGGARALLTAELTDRHGLLVIDNCEHVLDAVAETISDLLPACPQVTVLATSRERLDVPGEHAVAVRPLALPPVDQVTWAELAEHPATALFLERARAVTTLTPDDRAAPLVSAICRRLDGLPLAIELAASRTRLLGLPALVEALAARIDVLVGGRRAVPRHRTLDASIAWSYGLLSEAEQAALARLSVFPGTFDTAAAQDVIALDRLSPHAALALLTALVDKSLVAVREDRTHRRLRLLQPIRQYAAGRLEDAAEVVAARDAHLAHHLSRFTSDLTGLWSAALTRLHGTPQLAEELDDLRTAVAHARTTGRPDDIVDLHWPWFTTHLVHGTHRDGRRALRGVLAADGLGDVQRVRGLAMTIAFDAAAARPVEADARATEALEASRRLDDPLLRLGVLLAVGYARSWAGVPGLELAEEAWDLTLAHAEDWGDGTVGIAGAYVGTALSYLGGGRGLEAMLRGRDAALRVGDRWTAGLCAILASTEAMRTGVATDRAHELVVHAADIVPAGARNLQATYWTVARGAVSFMLGDLEESEEAYRRGWELAGPPGSGTHALCATVHAITVHVFAGPDAADAAARGVGVALARTSHRYWQTFAAEAQIYVLIARGQQARAREWSEEVRASFPPEPIWPVLRGRHAALRSFTAADPAVGLRTALEPLARLSADGWMMPARLLATAAAHALLRADRPVDAARAVGVGRALAPGWQHPVAEQMVFAPDRARMIELLGIEPFTELVAQGESLGAEPGVQWLLRGRGPNTRAPVGWEALTPTERRVARVIATGCTNAEAAAELFVSLNTVKTHLAHVYAKLGVRSRIELATAMTAADR